MTDPHIDEIIHWHDTKLSLAGRLCREDGRQLPTWNATYYEQQQRSGAYAACFELDFGLTVDDNPVQRMFAAVGLPADTDPAYRLYVTDHDRAVARAVISRAPRPRIVLLEGLNGTSTRGWDPGKIPALTAGIAARFGVAPLWFGSEHVPDYHGRPLTLRENIATLELCDVGLGVLSGPLHFAAAVGLPTITLFGGQPLHRAAPAYFLSQSIANASRRHRTLLAPSGLSMTSSKSPVPDPSLTAAETRRQHYRSWTNPGRQSAKSCLAAITVEEIMLMLQDMLYPTYG